MPSINLEHKAMSQLAQTWTDQQIVQRTVAALQWRSNLLRGLDGRSSIGVAAIKAERAGGQDE
jgi:hypothetical protein